MLRLIHSQTVTGALLVNDIDDGLPNKTAQRLGGTADPLAYARDGYANQPKQNCYIPRFKPTDSTIQGYIDLTDTSLVVMSRTKGTIAGLVRAGLITTVTFTAADVLAPALTLADLNTPGAGDLTLTGTKFLSTSPNVSKVLITGTGGPLTLTQAAIVAGAGTFTETSIFIPAALIPGLAMATSFAQVRADDLLTTVVALT